MNSIVRRIGSGAGPTGMNLTVIPFDQRSDFDPALMTPDTPVWIAEPFTTHLGSWDVSNSPYSIDAESRRLYLKPFNAPDFYSGGGGDHHIHVKVQDRQGEPIFGAGAVFTSDGANYLQPPTDPEKVVGRNTEAPHGWCNLPIFAASFPPNTLGPWSVAKQGWSDVVTGIGLPVGEHDSVCVVFHEMRWGDLPVYPSLAAQLIGEAEKRLVMPLNPNAALQRRILADGLIPNSPEFETERDGVHYVAQRGENGGSREVRVYYVQIGDWDNVKYEVRP